MGTKLTQREKKLKKQKREETRRRVSKRQNNQKTTNSRRRVCWRTSGPRRSRARCARRRTTPHGSKWVEKDVARPIRAEGEKNCKKGSFTPPGASGPGNRQKNLKRRKIAKKRHKRKTCPPGMLCPVWPGVPDARASHARRTELYWD